MMFMGAGSSMLFMLVFSVSVCKDTNSTCQTSIQNDPDFCLDINQAAQCKKSCQVCGKVFQSIEDYLKILFYVVTELATKYKLYTIYW